MKTLFLAVLLCLISTPLFSQNCTTSTDFEMDKIETIENAFEINLSWTKSSNTQTNFIEYTINGKTIQTATVATTALNITLPTTQNSYEFTLYSICEDGTTTKGMTLMIDTSDTNNVVIVTVDDVM